MSLYDDAMKAMAGENESAELSPSDCFFCDIEKFNEMYKLPNMEYPTLEHKRMAKFQTIIQEEVNEGLDIDTNGESKIDALVQIADWLGDMVVYCTSEMRRYGLDPSSVLRIIMESNFSKLGEDGKPIYHPETGKVMKGPDFFPPEPTLKEYIMEAMMRQHIQGE